MGISAVKVYRFSNYVLCGVSSLLNNFLSALVIQAQDQLLALIRTSNSTKVNYVSNTSQLTIMGRHLLT